MQNNNYLRSILHVIRLFVLVRKKHGRLEDLGEYRKARKKLRGKSKGKGVPVYAVRACGHWRLISTHS
jgi:hypothetical protein